MDQPLSCHRLLPLRPWFPCPQPWGVFLLPTHPRMLLGGDWSRGRSGRVGRDFGWRGWEDGVVAQEREVLGSRDQPALLLSHCPAASSSSGASSLTSPGPRPGMACSFMVCDILRTTPWQLPGSPGRHLTSPLSSRSSRFGQTHLRSHPSASVGGGGGGAGQGGRVRGWKLG